MAETNKQIVEKINKAFENNNPEEFLSYCADNVVWNMIGEKTTNGKTAVREWLAEMKDMEPPKFTVEQLIAEGDSVACCGDMTMKDKEGKIGKYSYCDVYRFNNGKITELRSYVVNLQTEGERSGKATA
jgi:ketosteroid isomerase-like protein